MITSKVDSLECKPVGGSTNNHIDNSFNQGSQHGVMSTLDNLKRTAGMGGASFALNEAGAPSGISSIFGLPRISTNK